MAKFKSCLYLALFGIALISCNAKDTDNVAITCSTWPRPTGFGCNGGKSWKALDTTERLWNTAKCQSLCILENETGCCYLGENVGCYWRPVGQSISGFPEQTTSVTCSGKYCASSQFRCDSGQCIPQSLVNDGQKDCDDGSDEQIPFIKLWEGNSATQDLVCRFNLNKINWDWATSKKTWATFTKEQFEGELGCENDEARSMEICEAKKGTIVYVYDDGDARSWKDDYARIEVLQDITGCETIGTFEMTGKLGKVQIDYERGGNLDGKVSSMEYFRP